MPHTGRTTHIRTSEHQKPYDRPKKSLLGRLGDRLRVALTPSFLQSNSSSAGDNTALSSCDVEVSHQPFQKVSTQLIEVEVDGYVARFDSDVVNGDSGVIPSIPCDQLSKDMSASETPLMSRAILSSKPDSMQNRGKDGTSEQTFLDGSTSASIAACNSVHPLSTVSSLSHKFNIEAFTSPSTKIRNERGDLHKSPFYNGHTTYGGRAAYRQSGCGDSYKTVSVVHQPVKRSHSSVADDTTGVTSVTAKRILEALQTRSHVPVYERRSAVRKSVSEGLESPLSFNTSVYKRLSSSAALHRQSTPPVRELLMPTVNVISQSRVAFSTPLHQQPAPSSSSSQLQSRYSGGGGKMRHSKFYSGSREHSKTFMDHVAYELPDVSLSTQLLTPSEFSFCPPLNISAVSMESVLVSDPAAVQNFSFAMPQLLSCHAAADSSVPVSDSDTAAGHSLVCTGSLPTTTAAHSLASYQFSVTGAVRKQHAAEVQVAGQRECLPAAVNSLCQGSVLDVLRPQPSSVTAVDKPAEAHHSLTQPPLSELFKASDDEWKCKVCCVQNTVTSDECVNCKANRLHVSSQDTGNVAKVETASGRKLPSLSEMFRRRDDEWTCDVCMISNKLTATECVACAAIKPQGSLSSAADSAPMKPLPSFNTSSNSALVFSTLPSVEQPFHSAGNWNATGGFKFGAVTSQPLSSTVTSSGQQPAECASAAAVAVTSELTMQSPLLMSGKLTAHVSSQHCSVLASMPVSNSTQLDMNAALLTVMSTTAVSPADAGSHQVDNISGGEVPNCCSASAACVTSSLALAAAECDSRQSVAVTSSDAVLPPVISTVSHTSAAAAATSPAFSLPLTATFTQQPASIFSFGKAAFAENSSRPLGVPATSALQFNATGVAPAYSTSVSPFGMSSFGTSTSVGSVSQTIPRPVFGFGVSSAPVFSVQPSQSLFGQAAAASDQQATVPASSFSFAPANNSPFVFGAHQPAAPSAALFTLGKRTNLDGANGDGSKRQATDVGGFSAVAVCHSSAVQPFALRSANSNVFAFGGNVQSSAASSAPWNIQASSAFASTSGFQFGQQASAPVFQFNAQSSSQPGCVPTNPPTASQRVFKKAARKLNR